MKLLDVVLGDRDVFPSPKNRLHDFRIARDFLLVAAIESHDLQLVQKLFNLAVGQLAALDAG